VAVVKGGNLLVVVMDNWSLFRGGHLTVHEIGITDLDVDISNYNRRNL